MIRFLLVIVRRKQGSEGLDGTSQDGHRPNSSLGQPRTNVFQFGWDEDQTRTKYIFKLRDKAGTGTNLVRPNGDENRMRTKHGRGRDEDCPGPGLLVLERNQRGYFGTRAGRKRDKMAVPRSPGYNL